VSFWNTIKMGREQSGRMLSGAVKLMIILTTWDLGYASTNYVWTNSPYEGAPYNAWTNAAHVLQTAVDAASAGDTVLVTNGLYNTGGRVTPGYALTNRVCITNAIMLRSVNGPAVTFIKGQEAVGGGHGNGAVRCVYLNSNASLIGFTLTNGYNMTSGDNYYDKGGGGIMLFAGTTVSNCTFSRNYGYSRAGGALFYSGGTANNCIFDGNVANRGGAAELYTGGTMNNCILSNNVAITSFGGGVRFVGAGTLNNCLIVSNSAVGGGGVSFESGGTIKSCTLFGNMATSRGGGILFYNGCGVLNNCIIWGNVHDSSSNIYMEAGATGNVNYTCSGPAQLNLGLGNIGSDPQFVGLAIGNYRLAANSSCVNTGTNESWMINAVDLDDRMRVRYGTVDMGCYETIYEGSIYRFGL